MLSSNNAKRHNEVFSRYTFTTPLAPFTRCLPCNEELIGVDKNEISDILQSLIRRYYQHFKRCLLCEKIYRHGSHVEKMQNSIKILCDNSYTKQLTLSRKPGAVYRLSRAISAETASLPKVPMTMSHTSTKTPNTCW
ncbi:MAG: Mut7-C RNAse domain-containing protein [Desulfopila sp.]